MDRHIFLNHNQPWLLRSGPALPDFRLSYIFVYDILNRVCKYLSQQFYSEQLINQDHDYQVDVSDLLDNGALHHAAKMKIQRLSRWGNQHQCH